MKHKLHDLLIAAANDADARFSTDNNAHTNCTLVQVLSYPKYNWVLVDKLEPFRQAMKDGKKVEFKINDDIWVDVTTHLTPASNYSADRFRIKLQPKQPKYLYVIVFNGLGEKVRFSTKTEVHSGEYVMGKMEVQND